MTEATVLDLWIVDPEEITDPALLAEYDRLLSPEERARNGRFAFERDRRLHRRGPGG